MLYLRMILVMCVSVYTSRVFLAQLGVVDYGIYNVVGGFVAMFTTLNSSFTASTTRFITYALGKGNIAELNKIFSASLSIHLVLALVIVLLLETVGLWFLNNKLVIPEERLLAANWVYQFIIVATFLNVMQVPFTGLINAHEDMSAFAWLSLLDVAFKLGIAYALSFAPIDKLIFYGALLLVVTVTMIVIYRTFCYRHYEECRYRLFWDKRLYKSMTSFAGWTIAGGGVWMLKNQGVNVLLNLFFGPAVNAARAVALQVSTSVSGFMYSFQSAVNPQITKYYAQGDFANMHTLMLRTLRFSFLLMFFLSFPIMLNIDFILHIWLKEVPEFTNVFVILVFVDILLQTALSSSIGAALFATGNIKRYQICESSILIFIIPTAYLFLKLGAMPFIVFAVLIVFNTAAACSVFFIACMQLGLSFGRYVKEVMAPISFVLFSSLPLPLFLRVYIFADMTVSNFFIISLIAFLCMLVSYLLFGINKRERLLVKKILYEKVKQK